MSIPFPSINLINVSVGTTGTVSFANVGIGAGGPSSNPSLSGKNAGTVHIYNESGSGLQIAFITSGDGFYLPAGAWVDRTVSPGEIGIKWTVIYNLPSPPVTLLLITYYSPNEQIPRTPTLGNSPIGIGGNISTVGTATLSNEGNTVQTLIIDIGQVGNTLLITINSDGSFSWAVLQGGTAHQVLKAQTAGNPLQIGKTGDVSEVLGQLTVDQKILATTGMITPINSGNARFYGDAANQRALIDIPDGTALWGFDVSGNLLTTANFAVSSNGGSKNVIDTTATQTFIKASSELDFQVPNGTNIFKTTSGGITLQAGTIGLLAGSVSRMTGALATACGSGTVISHGLGTTPTFASACPTITQPGSATVGFANFGSTTFTATVGSGSLIAWITGAT